VERISLVPTFVLLGFVAKPMHVCACVRVYGLGNTVEFSIWRITFRKMSICLIFWCVKRKLSGHTLL
jgi:hypothetical protein